MKPQVALLLGAALAGCAEVRFQAETGAALPARAEVLLDSRDGHELVAGLDRGRLVILARPEASSPLTSQWLKRLEYDLWCDLDGDGQSTTPETLATGTWSAASTRQLSLEVSLSTPLPPGPIYLQLSYHDTISLHTLEPRRLR